MTDGDRQAYDLAVIGGGINGCGIARDAAGRGLSVFLCEMGDLGGATSSASSKLIHGGLRYLEQREFNLVRKSLREREALLKSAPHLITPLRFILPHRRGLRPAWLIRAGLWLYDLLGGRRSLSPSRRVNLARDAGGETLKREFTVGFEYADCRVDDARLTLAVAKDARRFGAEIATRTRCESAARAGGLWAIKLRDGDGDSRTVRAKALVNAAGPWVNAGFVVGADSAAAPALRLVQGSHIVVKKWYAGAHAYLLQNDDRRVVFVIPFAPFEDELALVGTTEVDCAGDPGEARITPAESGYLRATLARFFTADLAAEAVVWSYSGVRPLFDDGADNAREVTRDYSLRLDGGGDSAAPLLTVYGGKLTTFRLLAEAAVDKLAAHFPAAKPAWTADAVLPGGAPNDGDDAGDAGDIGDALKQTYPFLPAELRMRYQRAYAWEAFDMLGGANSSDDLGAHFGHGLYAVEVAYQVANEWAMRAEDILWRRTKLGLRFDQQQTEALENWLRARTGADKHA